MARRTLNRHELRKQAEAAESKTGDDAVPVDGEATPTKKGSKSKAAAAPKVKKPRKKKEPPRLVARWGVFDGAMKQVAVFNYNQKAQAEQKVAELAAKKANAVYFVQIVKEPMPEPA